MSKKIFLILSLFCVILSGRHAFATIETFQLYDHPLTINNPVGNTEPWGLVLGGWGPSLFDFQTVQMTIDTSSGNAMFGGSLVHRASGQVYQFKTTLDNLRPSVLGAPFPQDLPYDDMIKDLETNGLAVTWDSIRLELEAPEYNDFDNAYHGPLTWIGKPDGNGNPSYFAYRWRLNPQNYPSPFYDVFGASAWLIPDDGRAGSGDFHFQAKRNTNVIPEPGTMALMAAGLSGMGWLKRRKKV